MQLIDFPKKVIKKAISDTLKHQQKAQRVNEDNNGSVKFILFTS